MSLPAITPLILFLSVVATMGSGGLSARMSEVALPLVVDERFRRGIDVEVSDGVQKSLPPGLPGFDSQNRAYYRVGETLYVKSNNTIETIDFGSRVEEAINRDIFGYGSRWDGKWETSYRVETSVIFDDSDRAYTLITPRHSNLRNAVLLYSTDLAKSWRAVLLRGITGTIEKRDSFNDTSTTPTILSHDNYGSPGSTELWLELFHFEGETLVHTLPPKLVSDTALLAQKHSGGGNSTFTKNGEIFIVYPSGNPPAGKRGTESFIRQFNLNRSGFTHPPISLGVSLTDRHKPDIHDFPVITGDKTGTLHVVIGGHHAPLRYTVSQEPLSVNGGWTPPTEIGGDRGHSSFTYPSLNIGPDQTLHVFARQESARYKFRLVQFQKPWGKPFRTWPNGTQHRVIAEPTRRLYAVWHHRVSMDRGGNLYLNFHYEPNQLTKDEARRLGARLRPQPNCRAGRCWYDVTPMAPTTLVSRNAGISFERF